ncbi:hypothetical protein Q7526_10555, partial [Glaesserella parasuis]|nr:hypothetical protein [Glaesserella parasuis]MDP0342533.1 hypothetical protein [Glaesserella parasuis]MDP0358299.1 hypothetical protein [Glaesserella parasuis]
YHVCECRYCGKNDIFWVHNSKKWLKALYYKVLSHFFSGHFVYYAILGVIDFSYKNGLIGV